MTLRIHLKYYALRHSQQAVVKWRNHWNRARKMRYSTRALTDESDSHNVLPVTCIDVCARRSLKLQCRHVEVNAQHWPTAFRRS